MKKTIADCKRFKIIFSIISALIGTTGVVLMIVCPIFKLLDSPLGMFIIIFLIVTGIFFFIWSLIFIRILVYHIDNHEVVCFSAFAHDYMIVDEQVVDRAGMSGFNTPVLTHKLGNKQLKFSHKRLKVNGELMLPIKK